MMVLEDGENASVCDNDKRRNERADLDGFIVDVLDFDWIVIDVILFVD